MVGEGGLGDVEQRHELAYADLAGVLSQHVNELQADRVAQSLGYLGHPRRLRTLDVGVYDRLAAALASRTLPAWGPAPDRRTSIYIYRLKNDICQLR